MNKFLVGCIFAAVSVPALANYFPPKDVQVLIEKSEQLNDRCRGGSGDDPRTMKACDQRDALMEKIYKKGYCFGGLNKHDAEYQYQWLPCKIVKTPH